MLTIEHPQLLSAIRDLNYGLLPFLNHETGRYLLAVKLNKEALLAARMNRGFKIYVVPAALHSTLGLVCAFFDDHDEPQTIRILFEEGDEILSDLTALFSQHTFEIYFFDEHDRELMGYAATLPDLQRFVAGMSGLRPPQIGTQDWQSSDRAITRWFGLRTPHDDAAAFDVAFGEALYDNDRIIIEAYKPDLRGTAEPPYTSLVREEPGSYQERDIGHMLWRVFPVEAVFANPIRMDTGRELCDLLVVLDDALIVVQAKDSPNTEASIRRSIGRKLATTLSHMDKAVSQLRGAFSHIASSDQLELRLSDGPISITLKNRVVYGMIVLNEMFDDHFPEYSAPALGLAQATNNPTIVVDLPALHILTNRIPEPYDFLAALDRLFVFAVRHGEYPRPQHSGPPGRARTA